MSTENTEILRKGSYTCTPFKYAGFSGRVYICNIPWLLKFKKKEYSSRCFTFELECNSDNFSPFWSVETFVKWGIKELNEERCELFRFDSQHKFYTVLNTVENSSSIQLSIEINKVTGIGCYEVDFSQPTTLSDVVLVIEGKHIHVNKRFLAMHSSVFEAMFFSGFKEEDQEEIELKDIEYESFVDMLTLIYPSAGVPIHKNNVNCLLEVADRFDITEVNKYCEKYLIKTMEIDISQKYILSDKYSLRNLQTHVLKSLECYHISKLREEEEFDNLKVDSKHKLIERLLELKGIC